MSVGLVPIISFNNLGFIGGLFLLPCVYLTAHFTHFPPNVLYVSSGGTARLMWEYHVDNRVQEFPIESPVWSFIDQTTRSESLIGFDGRLTNWSFVIKRPTCPPRLLNPDRVSRESNATLVITDVTTADNGIYKCSLKLKAASNSIDHQVQLVVTVRPTFLPSHPNNTYHIIEGQDLKLNCTAIGPPTPNITWVNITDGSVVIKTQGSGSAVLQIDNIRRYHAGVYECQAKNNPNEAATTTGTRITVYYKPTISKELSSTDLNSWNGRQVTLKCIVIDGLPTPNITWYNPDGQLIKTAIARNCQVVITTQADADYGLYRCKATNVAGSVELVIVVTQLFPPGAPNVMIPDQDIQASSVTVRWTKPGYDGGSPVIDYKVQINTNPLQEQNTAKTEHEFTGLTKNTRYEVRVYAGNVAGHGNASIIIFTTKKRGPPPLPSLHLSKSKTTITLHWTKPDENGGTIESYTIYQKQGVDKTWTSIHVVRDLSNLTYVIQLEDLEPGRQTYWFIVTATNEFGKSEIGSSDKGKEVYVLPKVTTATTATQSTTTALGGESMNKSGEQEKCSATALAVCAAFLAVSLVFIVLLLLYIWNIKRKEPIRNTITKRVTRNQTVEDPVYDNTIEMKENQASSKPVSPQQSSPPGEYEPIRTPRDQHPIEMSSRVDDYSSISETACHYQALSHPDTAGSSHQGEGPTYEPIRHPQFKEPNANQAKNVPDTTYQPLGVRLNPTDYQSLQTYDRNQLENNRSNQSTI